MDVALVNPSDIERICCFSGYRPEKLPWGYDEADPGCVRLRLALFQEICLLARKGTARTFLCGMAMGVDLWCAAAVVAVKELFPEWGVRLVAVLPYEGQADAWPERVYLQYGTFRALADREVVLSPHYRPGCMQRRDRFLVNHAATLLAVYDGQPGGTQYTVGYACRKNRRVLILDPATGKRTQ